MIPYGRQWIDDDDIKAVEAVLRSDFLTQGPVVPRFEVAIAELCGAPHAIAVNSATSALHVACQALDVRPGDEVWTSPISFVASANCARYCGATVDFVDIEPATANMSVAALERKLRSGRRPKVVIPVHFTGEPCDMAAIGALAKRYGFAVIEDASHAVGAHDRGTSVGACAHSDIAVFSFHPVKIITTGEGGMALTKDAALAHRMALLRSHGITRDQAAMTKAPEGPWYYQQVALGYNYRMTEMQAALGLSQLGRIKEFLDRRHALAAVYDALLADLPARPLARNPRSHSALHLYVVRIDRGRIDRPLRVIHEALRTAGIGVQLHYIPIHLQPYYQDLGFSEGDFPEAEAYYRAAISLPLFPALTDKDQARVVAALREVLS